MSQPKLIRRPSRGVADVAKLKKSKLSQDEVCVGHTLSVVIGQRNLTSDDYYYTDLHKFVDNRKKDIFSVFKKKSDGHTFFLLIDIILAGSGYPRIMSGGLNNVEGHSTIVNVSSRDGKNLKIWYVDPGGWINTHTRDIRQWKSFNDKYSTRDWFNDTSVTLDKVIHDPIPRDIRNRWDGILYKIKHILTVWKNSDRYEEIRLDFVKWNKNWEDGKNYLHVYSLMGAMFIFTKLANVNHVEIVNPHVSMKGNGPQVLSEDGVCLRSKNNKLLNKIYGSLKIYGACVVWSQIYSIYLKQYHSSLSDDDLILFLRENPYVGEYSPFELLGKMAFDRNIDNDIKGFLLNILKVIPDESELECINTNEKCLTRYHTDLLDTYDKIIQLWNTSKVINRENTSLFLKQLSNNRFPMYRFDIILHRVSRKEFMSKISVFNLILIALTCKHKTFFE